MTTAREAPASRIIPIHELAWQEVRPGMRAKQVWEDPETQRKAMLVRFDPGATIPLHRHDGDELIFVIEGSVADESGVITAGNMSYRPNGCVHTVSSPNGATVLAVVTGSVAPAESRGDAPGSRPINVADLPWVESRPNVQAKQVWDHPTEQRRAGISRFAPGAELPLHRHVGDELIFVIEGASIDESGPTLPGHLNHRPNGCVHSVKAPTGATVLAFIWGGIEPVER